MRRVYIFKNGKTPEGIPVKVQNGIAWFHCFSHDSDGDPCAIVEDDEGNVFSQWLQLIQFVEPLKPGEKTKYNKLKGK